MSTAEDSKPHATSGADLSMSSPAITAATPMAVAILSTVAPVEAPALTDRVEIVTTRLPVASIERKYVGMLVP